MNSDESPLAPSSFELGVNPDEVSNRDEFEKAREIALASLTAAPRTRQQLTEKLAQRGISESVIRSVLDRLTEVGLVDDEAYARAWIASRQRKGFARYAIQHELKRKGIPQEVLENAISEVEDTDELAAAEDLVERKVASLTRLPDEALRKRLVNMLARKGFSPGVAYGIVNRAMRARGEEEA